MIGSAQVVAVVAVTDIERGKEFYEGTLGLQEGDEETEPGGALYVCGDSSQLLVYESQFAGTNEATAVSWQVDDIAAEVADLKEKGITFEQYDLPGSTRDGDIHTMGTLSAAWFKDPDGNILNLVSRS
jgi:catechol 2,3-dioxygenase-like lactoylglutathione lyase family enzyme